MFARVGVAVMGIGFYLRCLKNDETKEKGVAHKLAELVMPCFLASSVMIPLAALSVQGLSYAYLVTQFEGTLGHLAVSLVLGMAFLLLTDLRAGLPKAT